MQTAVCPACQRQVKLPPNFTGRAVKTMCPKCGELLTVQPTASRHPQDEQLAALTQGRTNASALGEARSQLGAALSTTRGRGLTAVLLGLLALAFLTASLCLPAQVGYAGLPLAGLGILLGLHTAFRGMLRREREALFAVGGIAISSLAVALIWTHTAMKSPEKPGSGDEHQPTILERERELK
jgi:hypothetical protein